MVVSPNSNKNQNIQAESVNNEGLTLFFFFNIAETIEINYNFFQTIAELRS